MRDFAWSAVEVRLVFSPPLTSSNQSIQMALLVSPQRTEECNVSLQTFICLIMDTLFCWAKGQIAHHTNYLGNFRFAGTPEFQNLSKHEEEQINYNERFHWSSDMWSEGRIGFGPFGEILA